jgi:UDP-glucose 4-epimerase
VDDLSTGAIENLTSVRADPRLCFVQAKVSECPELGRLVKAADGIFHLAAAVGVDLVVRSPIQTFRSNLDVTEAILASAGEHQVPFLLASTSEVYGKSRRPVAR